METKELMIGNYVLRHTGEITKVLEVLTNSVTIKVKDYKAIKTMTIPSKSISPIILEEEHLVKLGFEKLGEKYFYKKGIYIRKGKDSIFTFEYKVLEYIHELQNYYYLHIKEHLKYDFTADI